MSLPRRILPGAVYFLTRRCLMRMFLLRPDEDTTKIIKYCLAVASKKYKIDLIAWLAMSNHYHSIVHDPFGNLPEFIAHFHKMVAKALNRRWGRKEGLWSSTETCVVQLFTRRDILRKVVYVLTNPVAANLVARVEDWPGASSWMSMGAEESQIRPTDFFNRTRTRRLPDEVPLQAVVPPPLAGEKELTAEEWSAMVTVEVQEAEEALGRARVGDVLGRDAVMMQSERTIPEGWEKVSTLTPAIACEDDDLRKEEIRKLKYFRDEYRRCWLQWLTKIHNDIRFPAGTYKMFRQGVICEVVNPLC